MATAAIFPSHADDAGLIELYPYVGSYTLAAPPADVKPVLLQVPETFRYGSSKGATRSRGVNVLTYYPSFSSPNDPANASFGLQCAGDCNGRILVSIENRSNGTDVPGRIASNAIQDRGLSPNGSIITQLGPEHGFDSGFEAVPPASAGEGQQVKRYLFHHGQEEIGVDLVADCSINRFAKTCTLHFMLKCDPNIYVQVVAIDMRHIGDFFDVVKKTDRFVTSMLRKPACV